MSDMTAMIVFTTPPKSPAIGAYLKSLRSQADLSLNDMALKLGYTRKQVQNWEAGTSPVKRVILTGYAVEAGQDPNKVIAKAAQLAGENDGPDGPPVSVRKQGGQPRRPRENPTPAIEIHAEPQAA